jgi:hypothetical protein
MKIDSDLVAIVAKEPPQREISPQTGQSSHSRGNHHLVEQGVAFDNRSRRGLDHVGEPGIWKAFVKGTNRRCREYDVTDLTQTN